MDVANSLSLGDLGEWPERCSFHQSMKIFLLLLLSVIALFVWQRQGNDAAPAPRPRIETRTLATATPRPASERHWTRQSLDRTHEAIDQVRQTRAPDEQP